MTSACNTSLYMGTSDRTRVIERCAHSVFGVASSQAFLDRRHPKGLLSLALISLGLATACAPASAAAPADARVPSAAIPPSAYNPLETFAPLTLPEPVNRMRAGNGAPGPDYWQNAADYEIHANLDPTSRILSAQ